MELKRKDGQCAISENDRTEDVYIRSKTEIVFILYNKEIIVQRLVER